MRGKAKATKSKEIERDALMAALDEIESEKGISKEYMLERIQNALVTIYKRSNNSEENVVIINDPDKNKMQMVIRKTAVKELSENPVNEILLDDAKNYKAKVIEGDTVDIPVNPKEFGRIMAQNAKQIIIQGMREAERGNVEREMESKTQEVVSGVISRIDFKNKNVILEFNHTEAVLDPREQIPGEVYTEGDHLRVYVAEIRKTPKGAKMVISRTHPGLVRRLFEIEVPEIAEGLVEIKSLAREAGSRSKISVYSNEADVDPVGACIGPKSSRVTKIVRELGGERIDIIKYSSDPAEYIAASLSPAEVINVEIVDEEAKSCRVTVPESQLSLAIGKEGQNARLAAKLTGWKIDIHAQE